MDDWFFSIRIQDEIITSDAQSFENLFCKIMKESDDNFNKVKASGKKGDKKCDGFNSKTGDYYCVYAPEDFSKKYTIKNGLIKIKKDIDGIISEWENIKVINYVINDKFKGIPPDIHQLIIELNKSQKNIEIKLFSMEKLKNITLSLTKNQKQSILGFAPDLKNSVATLQFNIIEEIIKYLEKNVIVDNLYGNLNVPDFSNKIQFNNLSNEIKDLLNCARYQIYKVDEFFENSSIYSKEDLRNFCNGLYIEACKKISKDVKNFSDERFLYILKKMSYDIHSKAVMDNVLIIMTNFFESCDIFEEPISKEV